MKRNFWFARKLTPTKFFHQTVCSVAIVLRLRTYYWSIRFGYKNYDWILWAVTIVHCLPVKTVLGAGDYILVWIDFFSAEF